MLFPESSYRLDFRLVLAAIAAWAVGAAVFFRQALSASFDVVFGDTIDGSLVIYIHEHLVRALAGHANFLSPPFFFPQSNVLGFTDAFVLDIPLYAPLRWFGFDMFLSAQMMIIMQSLLCFIATFIICARYLAVRPGIAICAAALITFPNNLFFKATAGHLVFFVVYDIPCIVLLALWGLEEFPRLTTWSYMRVAAAAIAYGLLFATAYYIAWLLALTLLIAAGIVGVLQRQNVVDFLTAHRKPIGTLLAVMIAGFTLGLIPFFLIYIPVLSIVPGRTYYDYINFAPQPKDIINVSTGNLLWGWLIRYLPLNQGDEWPLATTPIMTAIALALCYQLRRRERHIGVTSWQTGFATCCLLTWVIAWLVTVKIKTFSLFWLADHVLPGATAIRAGARIQLIANTGVVLALAVLLTRWIEMARFKVKTKALAGAIALLCLIEQVNGLQAARLPRAEKLQWLAAVPSPPAECQVFLVDNRSAAPSDWFYETDAMWMTVKTGLPTLNGYSSWTPPGWPRRDPSIDYFDATRQWIALHRMNDRVCLYERSERRWSRFR